MDEEKKEIEKKEEDETVEAKVDKEEKEEKKTATDIEKEMQDMLNDLSEQMGIDKNQIKVVSIKMPKRNFRTILFESLYYIITSCLLVIGLSGYINWCEGTWYQLLFFALIFSIIELVLRNIFFIVFKKTIIQTFGLILILPSFLSMLACFFIPFIPTPTRIARYAVVFIILFIVREFIKRYSLEFFRRHKFKKDKKQK